MLRTSALTVALLTAMVTGCSESGTSPLAPEESSHEAAPALEVGTAAALVSDRFLRCPVEDTRSVSRTLGLLGGSIILDGHRFTLPPAAVLFPTRFTLTVPASDHVEVEIHAEGHDSFTFLVPASVTISYDRCGDKEIDPGSLSVWHVGGVLRSLLEDMGGLANAPARHISFSTGHLSGFIIAN